MQYAYAASDKLNDVTRERERESEREGRQSVLSFIMVDDVFQC